MDNRTFEQIVQDRLEKIQHTLVVKGKEYATENNRLHNFDRGASVTGQTREKALWGYAVKHYVSFLDMLDNMEKGKMPTPQLVDDKIGDLINYLILIEACILDTADKYNNSLVKTANGAKPSIEAGRGDTSR